MSDAHSEASAQCRPTKGVFGEVIFSQKDKKTDVSIDMMLLSTSSSLPIFSTLYISNFYLYFKQVWLIPEPPFSRQEKTGYKARSFLRMLRDTNP